MKDIYLKAAEKVARKNNYTCNVIDKLAGEFRSNASKEYSEIFRPNKNFKHIAWLCTSGDFECWQEMQQWRVLALLFMHWISQEEK